VEVHQKARGILYAEEISLAIDSLHLSYLRSDYSRAFCEPTMNKTTTTKIIKIMCFLPYVPIMILSVVVLRRGLQGCNMQNVAQRK
jgi:hypothetical protein